MRILLSAAAAGGERTLRAEDPIGAMRPGIIEHTRYGEEVSIAAVTDHVLAIEHRFLQIDVFCISGEYVVSRARHTVLVILFRQSPGFHIGTVDGDRDRSSPVAGSMLQISTPLSRYEFRPRLHRSSLCGTRRCRYRAKRIPVVVPRPRDDRFGRLETAMPRFRPSVSTL